MDEAAFCTARVGELIETQEGCNVDFIYTELHDTDSVVRFLEDTHDRFAIQLADQNAERPDDERIGLSEIGGFGVQLTNRFGGRIEIAVGRRFCLLIRLAPPPTRIYRTPTHNEGTLVFFLDGWHHTEMELSELVSRDEYRVLLSTWLELNVLPDMA
ncbi:MAG: hypothetical protein JNL58_00160 [Planctomyces sp.]|nr:hypothetical protein [Planctomyces sp.]